MLWVLLPGAACAAWTLPCRTSRALQLGVALALSVPIAGALIALVRSLAGLSAGVAAGGVLLVSAAALILRRMRPSESAGEARESDTSAAWWIAAASVVLVASFPIASEWWRVYSDAWTHAGIVRAVEQGVPPLDPGFAGVRLQYASIYHAFVAGAHELFGIDVFAMMVGLEVTALASVILCAASALPRARGATVAWTLVLLVFGMNALFPLVTPLIAARAFVGEVRGWAELHRQFGLFPLDNERTGVFLRGVGGEDFFLDKFMVATPFALSLAAFTAWLAMFRRWLAAPRPGALVLCAALALAAGLTHPVVGVFLGAATVLALGLVLLPGGGAPAFRRPFLQWTGATLAGLLPVVLYTASIVGGKGGTHRELPFDLNPLKLLGYATCLALGLWFAARPLARMARGDGADRAWALWIFAAGGVALVSRLPGPSGFFTVDKLAYLVWIPLVLAGGEAFAAWIGAWHWPQRVAIALLLFAPVNGLMIASRIADAHNGARQPFGLEGFRWIREHTPADAVLIVQAGDWESSGFADRDQYYSLGHAAIQLGYDLEEIHARADLTARLFATGQLNEADRLRLLALHRPVYVVWANFRDPMWRYTPGALARAVAPPGPRPAFDPAFQVVFRSPEIEVLRPFPANQIDGGEGGRYHR
ncbi:MAG: hypothetical protein ABI960_03830 [Candidatus Eisenbacteria bacterium]